MKIQPTKPNGGTYMKLTNAWIEEIEINGKGYAVMVLERDKE